MEYMPIDKADVPYTFDFELGGKVFTFTTHYNERFDFFTIDIEDNDGPIMLGEKIVYGRALFSSMGDDPRLPIYPITPFDEGDKETAVTYANLNESVFLFLGVPNEQ